MTKEELYKVSDILNDVLSNYLHGSETEEVIVKFEDEIEKSELLKEEPASEDLKEAIGEYCSNPDNFISYVDTGFAYRSEQKDDIPLIIKAIKFGAQWQKEQMMKDAVDGCCISNGKEVGSAIDSPIGMVFFKYNKFNVGDKVKVIIIKE